MDNLLEIVKEQNLMIPYDYQEFMESQPVNKPRSTYWMKDSNKRIPDAWMKKFEGWSFAHEQKSGYRVEPRLPLLETFDIEEDVEQGYLFPTDKDLESGWLQDEVDEHGIEALAWYRPFHISPQREWGITITDRGIWYLAKNVMSQKYNHPYTLEQIHDCFELAYEFLYYHELFHFKVEYAATILELNSPHKKPVKVYAPFWEDGFHRPGPNNCSPLEEAMANEYARWKVCQGQPKELKDAIENFMRTQQPSGYRDFAVVKHHRKWQRGLESLIESMIGRSTPFAKSIFEQYKSYIDEEESVPCRIITTGLPDAYSVRLMSLAEYCRTRQFEKELKKIKKVNPKVVKEFQTLLSVIKENYGQIPRGADNKWEPHFAKNVRSSQKVEISYLRGSGKKAHFRLYRELLDETYVFRRIEKKSEGTQITTLDSFKNRPLYLYGRDSVLHNFTCSHI